MPRIVFDAFHHMPPGHRIGPHIAVGGYQTNYGRYSPGDVYHPNGLAMLEAELAPRHPFRMLNEPLSDAARAARSRQGQFGVRQERALGALWL